jgi:hypothetical protein
VFVDGRDKVKEEIFEDGRRNLRGDFCTEIVEIWGGKKGSFRQ